MFGSSSVISLFVSFLSSFAKNLAKEENAGCFTLIVFLHFCVCHCFYVFQCLILNVPWGGI